MRDSIHSAAIDELVELTAQIQQLAVRGDWMAMQPLTDARLSCLEQLFNRQGEHPGLDFSESDRAKLTDIVHSNVSILNSAHARQTDIAAAANQQRKAAVAHRAYASHTGS